MMDDKSVGGRPSSYDPKYCEEIIAYFSVKPYQRSEDTKALEAADFPSFAGFACKIGVHRETLLNWTEKHPEFFDAYKRAKELQENFLLINGMRELVHPAFAIFTAKNVLGYRDKQPGEVDTIVNNTNKIEVQKVDIEERVQQIKSAPKASGE